MLAVLYMGVLGTAVTHSLWNYSLRVMDASFCSMFYPMQPLVSSIFGRSVSARSRHTRLRYRRADDLLRHRGGGDFPPNPGKRDFGE